MKRKKEWYDELAEQWVLGIALGSIVLFLLFVGLMFFIYKIIESLV